MESVFPPVKGYTVLDITTSLGRQISFFNKNYHISYYETVICTRLNVLRST